MSDFKAYFEANLLEKGFPGNAANRLRQFANEVMTQLDPTNQPELDEILRNYQLYVLQEIDQVSINTDAVDESGSKAAIEAYANRRIRAVLEELKQGGLDTPEEPIQ